MNILYKEEKEFRLLLSILFHSQDLKRKERIRVITFNKIVHCSPPPAPPPSTVNIILIHLNGRRKEWVAHNRKTIWYKDTLMFL